MKIALLSDLHANRQAVEAVWQHVQEQGFDLLVMGTRGHGALAKLVMGSVATQVLAQCKLPVLLIR